MSKALSKNRTYNKYKQTNYQWLGDIPEHWQWLYLSQVASEQQIKNTGVQEKKVLSLSFGNIIRKVNVNAGLVPESYETYQIVDAGNIIMRLTDLQNDHRSLRTGLVKERGIITSAYTCLKPHCNPAYLQLLLHSYDTQKYFYGLGGGVRQSIGYKDIRYTYVPLPPRGEQDQIVRFLDWKVSQINKLINAKKKQIALLQEQIDVLTNNAINNPKGTIRLKYMVEEIREWINREVDKEYCPVGVLNRGRGVFQKQALLGKDLGDSDFFHVKPDTLLFSGQFAWEGAVAITTKDEANCIASHRYYSVKGKKDICRTEYLWAFFQTKLGDMILNQCSHGAAGRNRPLNYNELLNETIPVPAIEKQDRIADLVLLLQRHRILATNNAILLNEYRARLISDVVTGKMDIRNIAVPEYETIKDISLDDNEGIEDKTMKEVVE